MVVYDLVRTHPIVVSGAVWGQSAMVINDEVFVHPPPVGQGWAEVMIRDVKLSGQTRITGELAVNDQRGPEVVFEIQIRRDGQTVAQSSMSVNPGYRSTFSCRIPPIFGGTVSLVLRTRVQHGYRSHHYGTSSFARLMIS